MIGEQRGAGVADAAQQRVEHVARAVAVGKQLAVGFFVQRNVQLSKETDGVVGRERAQHSLDQRARPPQKSASDTTRLVTLQRVPPLTRIFAPGFRAPSSTTTDRAGLARRTKIAVARPAAPAPTIDDVNARPICVLRQDEATADHTGGELVEAIRSGVVSA